ncbi:MAG: response regulator [Burkholderiales bacterium]|nr:response regulator [Burkholderiales bacterium]
MNAEPRILVVDDEDVVRRSHLRVLSNAHCSVRLAENGEAALQAMETDRFDVVLLDLRMPGMDGMTVLRQIKDRWPESQVIVITAYPTLETAKEAVRLGACDYLSKPVPPDEVIQATRGAVMEKRWALRKDGSAQEFEEKRRAGASAGPRGTQGVPVACN